MRTEFEIEINSLIPFAVREADAKISHHDFKNSDEYVAAWNESYHLEMHRLTKDLRVGMPT